MAPVVSLSGEGVHGFSFSAGFHAEALREQPRSLNSGQEDGAAAERQLIKSASSSSMNSGQTDEHRSAPLVVEHYD